jgi:hypothetical protein
MITVLDNDGIFLSIDNFEIDKTYLDYFDV